MAVVPPVTKTSTHETRWPDVALRCPAGMRPPHRADFTWRSSLPLPFHPCAQAFNQSSRLIVATAAGGEAPVVFMCGSSGPVTLFARSGSTHHG